MRPIDPPKSFNTLAVDNVGRLNREKIMNVKYDSRLGIPVSIAFIFAIGYLDYISGFKFSLFPLYLIPIAVISWNENITITILATAIASTIITIKDVHTALELNSGIYFYWDMFVKVCMLLLISYTFWKIRSLMIEKDRLNIELNRSLTEIQELREMIPICAWCHSVRNDKGFYEKIETYLSKVTGSKLTHGICPTCTAKYYGDFTKQSDDKSDRSG
jgi:hypothetical protein